MTKLAGTIGGDIGVVLGHWRALVAGGMAHVACDGFTDMLYVFFPLWQAEFFLGFAEIGFLKLLFSGMMASFQVPSSLLAERVGVGPLLIAGTLLTSGAVLLFSCVPTPVWLALLLMVAGLGASTQHPVASSLVANMYADKHIRRTALSIYNLSGDIGKLIFPAAAALIISWNGWRTAGSALGMAGLAVAAVLWFLVQGVTKSNPTSAPSVNCRIGWLGRGEEAFVALVGIGVLDSATRVGFLLFFPFLLMGKGAEISMVGFALSLVFAGGVFGKFVCGVIAIRIGPLRTVVVSEVATAACIGVMIMVPMISILVLAPILGAFLNGTSSVLYGSVPELVAEERRNRAFALFYTATTGSSAVSPFVYGLFGDQLGLGAALTLVSVLVLATVPLTLPLRGRLVN